MMTNSLSSTIARPVGFIEIKAPCVTKDDLRAFAAAYFATLRANQQPTKRQRQWSVTKVWTILVMEPRFLRSYREELCFTTVCDSCRGEISRPGNQGCRKPHQLGKGYDARDKWLVTIQSIIAAKPVLTRLHDSYRGSKQSLPGLYLRQLTYPYVYRLYVEWVQALRTSLEEQA